MVLVYFVGVVICFLIASKRGLVKAAIVGMLWPFILVLAVLITLGQFLYFAFIRPSAKDELLRRFKVLGIKNLPHIYSSKIFLENYLDSRFKFEFKEGDEFYSKTPVIQSHLDVEEFLGSVNRFLADYNLIHQAGVGYYWERKN